MSARVCVQGRARRGARGKVLARRSKQTNRRWNKSGGGWSPPGTSQSREPSAPRASHRRGQRATANAAGGCGDLGSPPRSTTLQITLTLWDKEQSPGTGLARCTFLLLGEGGPQLVGEDTAEPPFSLRRRRHSHSLALREHTRADLRFPMPLDGASGPASRKRCRSGEAGVGPRKLPDHR